MIPDYEKLCVDASKTIELIKSEKIDYVLLIEARDYTMKIFHGSRNAQNAIRYLMPHNISVPSYLGIL